jgi:hypothetical protein
MLRIRGCFWTIGGYGKARTSFLKRLTERIFKISYFIEATKTVFGFSSHKYSKKV